MITEAVRLGPLGSGPGPLVSVGLDHMVKTTSGVLVNTRWKP